MTNPTIEVLRVPVESGGGLGVNVNGVQQVWIKPEYRPALLAALLEDAGAVKVHAISTTDGMVFKATAFSSSAWLLPIPEGAEG